MTSTDNFDHSIERTVAQYVAARGRNGAVISVATAVRAIRTALTDCPYTDGELADMVAKFAVEHGCNVHFDAATSNLKSSNVG